LLARMKAKQYRNQLAPISGISLESDNIETPPVARG
jgi:hypothetical protein